MSFKLELQSIFKFRRYSSRYINYCKLNETEKLSFIVAEEVCLPSFTDFANYVRL